MTGDKIRYRKREYKYQLVEDYSVNINAPVGFVLISPFFSFEGDGFLHINSGYAWDGPSGYAVDTLNFMRGSLIHDVLYQAIRMGVLSVEWKEFADRTLQKICLEDGMSSIRAWWVYQGVHKFGASSCVPGTDEIEIMEAP